MSPTTYLGLWSSSLSTDLRPPQLETIHSCMHVTSHVQFIFVSARHELFQRSSQLCRKSSTASIDRLRKRNQGLVRLNMGAYWGLLGTSCFLVISANLRSCSAAGQCTLGGSTDYCGYTPSGAISGNFPAPCTCQRTLCCSPEGHCGPEAPITTQPASAYCGAGCQQGYGTCSPGMDCVPRVIVESESCCRSLDDLATAAH